MAKTCIICGNRAGSAEHVFPAVLGGRRTNRGIYCGPHNEGFSPLAKAIGGQLKTINALLAVRPDHADKAEPFRCTSPTGEQLVVFDGKVERATPTAANKDQRPQLRLVLGGDDGLKAIAYVALTFFAAHFQDHARKPGMQPIKDFLLGAGANEFVWWESEALLEGLPQNPFAFGHTIVLATSAATGEATAFVSLFGSLNFGIAIATVDGLSDETVVVFIDPQADHPPHDIQVARHNTILIEVERPEPLHAHLARTVSEGTGEKTLQRLVERIEEWKFGKEMAADLDRLNGIRSLPATAQKAAVEKIVQEHARRIYRLMRHIADDFEAAKKGGQGPERIIIPILKAMVALNAPPGPTFSVDGERVMIASLDAFTKDLAAKLAVGDVDMDYLWGLFSGGHGAGIVGHIMFAAAAKSLPE
ncbi:hypothetical protein ACVWZZ_006578 [Bradyrhizobium sp. LM6.10]